MGGLRSRGGNLLALAVDYLSEQNPIAESLAAAFLRYAAHPPPLSVKCDSVNRIRLVVRYQQRPVGHDEHI